MRGWGRLVLLLAVIWLFTRWLGFGPMPLPAPRTIAIWSGVALACFLVWRDGRALLARYGFARQDAPLAVLEGRLARGELDLATYRQLREELLATAGIAILNKNNQPKRVPQAGRRP